MLKKTVLEESMKKTQQFMITKPLFEKLSLVDDLTCQTTITHTKLEELDQFLEDVEQYWREELRSKCVWSQ